ncbi:TPA: hypothetical protein OXO77_001885 [Acinetobacter baumannii]|uniref:hypothetical protein n=1 Tax=Acinetobacter TaxID=469 RepID=UPI00028DAEEC|nr:MULTISPECIES: hypothetical protein [Acinetobacter]EHU1293709.1 hypothetical protein [Acinetobacter baumannii]EHU1349308.1 hypothetical protein [Acinetobacter baumannii]EHU1493226.1 hypothetical protein [Acinetobacter baumannii]EHU1496974.1 hypothetical protein [Acinetobacter baumannii]EHU1532780.1 hypothetical protein [Acinetobacter baumannii]
MKVKFLDVIQMGTHLYKSGEVGEFSSQTAEELIKKGLAVLDDGTETAGTTPDQKPKTGKGGKGSKGKNAVPPKNENGADGEENKGSGVEANDSTNETNGSEDENKSDKNTQTPTEDTKPE